LKGISAIAVLYQSLYHTLHKNQAVNSLI